MNRQVFGKVLLVLVIVGFLAGGGYALDRAAHARGYARGLAKNIDEQELTTFIEQGCGFRHWGCVTRYKSSPPPIVRLAFLGGMLLFLPLVVRAATARCSHIFGGNGWQLSFGPRPPVDSPAPGSQDTPTDE